MRRLNLKALGIAVFAVVAAVAAAFGCPVFRNPGAYVGVGGAIAHLRTVVDLHRRT